MNKSSWKNKVPAKTKSLVDYSEHWARIKSKARVKIGPALKSVPSTCQLSMNPSQSQPVTDSDFELSLLRSIEGGDFSQVLVLIEALAIEERPRLVA